MKRKQKIFIGSSSNCVSLIEYLFNELDELFDVHLWNRGFFEPSMYTLECFEEKAKTFDYAIFVLHPDDIVIDRKEEKNKTRDNVIFEYGLFLNALGRKNVFLIEPDPRNMKVDFPSDLYGITTIRYDPIKGANCMTGVGIRIKEQINLLNKEKTLTDIENYWPLKVGIISKNKASIKKLQTELDKYNGDFIISKVYNNFDDTKKAMIDNEIDCAFVDIFSLPSGQGVEIISYARDRHRSIGFVLYGKKADLCKLSGVTSAWKTTFEHFWKLQSDENSESFRISVEDMIIMCFLHKLSKGFFGDVPGNLVKKFFTAQAIGSLKEWKNF